MVKNGKKFCKSEFFTQKKIWEFSRLQYVEAGWEMAQAISMFVFIWMAIFFFLFHWKREKACQEASQSKSDKQEIIRRDFWGFGSSNDIPAERHSAMLNSRNPDRQTPRRFSRYRSATWRISVWTKCENGPRSHVFHQAVQFGLPRFTWVNPEPDPGLHLHRSAANSSVSVISLYIMTTVKQDWEVTKKLNMTRGRVAWKRLGVSELIT